MDRQPARTCPPGGDPGGTGPDRGASAAPTRSPASLVLAASFLLVTAILCTGSVAATAADAATPPGDARVVATPLPTPPLVLVAQSPWVTGASTTFDVQLRTHTPSVPAAGLGVTVAVYPCLSSISGFDQSTTSTALGTPVSSTTSAIPVSSLPTLADGSVDLRMPVVVGTPPTSGTTAAAPFTIHLQTVSGQCQAFPDGGVFPVRIQLVDLSGGSVSGGSALGGFTTHLVYNQASSVTQPLRVSIVLPIQMTVRASHGPTPAGLLARPYSALATPAERTVDAVTATVAAIAGQNPPVPMTLQVSGQTVTLLDTPAHQTTINQIGQLAATPSVHQLTSAPFTPVDATALVDGGLGTELGLQVARGTEAVDAAARPATASPGPSADLGPWITGDGLDQSTVATLAGDGFHQIVLPASQLTSTPTDGSTTSPFTLTGARGTSVLAMASDDDLTTRFNADPGNPVLAAHQLLAELAQLYFERPNSPTPRAVLAVAPTGWSDDPAFVGALLAALPGNPVVQAATTSQVFSLFPTPSTCRTSCRLTPPTGGGGLPVGAIVAQRVRVNGFATSAPTAHPLATQLGDLVLSGETQTLRPSQQSAVLANAGAAVDAQFGQLAVEGNLTVTLTARGGRVPVTIGSNAPYPVTAVLSLSSDKLLFPNGLTQWSEAVSLPPRYTRVVYVQVQTRTSGVFRLDVTLRAPSGPVHLAVGELSVRSTSSSVVGLALTVGAVAVLAVWWFRTSRRRRRARRAEESAEDMSAAPLDPPGPPVPVETVGTAGSDPGPPGT